MVSGSNKSVSYSMAAVNPSEVSVMNKDKSNFVVPLCTSSGLKGLTLSPLDVHSGTTKFDLSLFITETSEGLTAAIEYDTDLFEPETIERMLRHYETLLEGVAAGPG